MESLRVCSLASGSNGNAYYIEYAGRAILVDMGVSYRCLRARAQSRHINLQLVSDIFVSHEHSDHVYGLPVFCRHTNAIVHMTHGTRRGLRSKYTPPTQNIKLFSAGEVISLPPFTIHSFAKPHDVVEPCSFRIEVAGLNIGVFTDIGMPTDELKHHLSLCHLAFLEANYDEQMLINGPYTRELKQRISGGHGHLSNVQSAQIVRQLVAVLADELPLHTILLSHISQDNNTPQIALKEFADIAKSKKIMVMSRSEASPVFLLSTTQSTEEPPFYEIPERLDRPAYQFKFNF